MVSTRYRLDSAMVRVMELDIKVDVLLGDFDRGFDPEITKHRNILLKLFTRLIKTNRLRKGI
jgi:hypothetical protein